MRAASSFQVSWLVTSSVDCRETAQERAVEIALEQCGQHDLVEDGLALVRPEVGGLEAAAGFESDGAMRAVGLHVEEDDQAVVESGSPDAPRSAERLGVGRSLLVAGPRPDLGIDDDLGPGPGLDGLDDPGRLGLRRVGEDACLVVDHDAGDRLREGRPGSESDAAGRAQPADEDGHGQPSAECSTLAVGGAVMVGSRSSPRPGSRRPRGSGRCRSRARCRSCRGRRRRSSSARRRAPRNRGR